MYMARKPPVKASPAPLVSVSSNDIMLIINSLHNREEWLAFLRQLGHLVLLHLIDATARQKDWVLRLSDDHHSTGLVRRRNTRVVVLLLRLICNPLGDFFRVLRLKTNTKYNCLTVFNLYYTYIVAHHLGKSQRLLKIGEKEVDVRKKFFQLFSAFFANIRSSCWQLVRGTKIKNAFS